MLVQCTDYQFHFTNITCAAAILFLIEQNNTTETKSSHPLPKENNIANAFTLERESEKIRSAARR